MSVTTANPDHVTSIQIGTPPPVPVKTLISHTKTVSLLNHRNVNNKDSVDHLNSKHRCCSI